jgi:hypothetical protein
MSTTLKQRQHAFVQLGKALASLAGDHTWPGFACGLNEEEWTAARSMMTQVKQYNGWFTEENVRKAMGAWGRELTEEALEQWLNPYAFPDQPRAVKTVAVICAGNIPMVGFHDVMCTLLAGHNVLIKLSSDDHILLPFALTCLTTFEPALKKHVSMAGGKLEAFDAMIATGSNNTSRYFEYYFGKYPHIIRKNRTSVAVVDGRETEDELKKLGHDIFDYFGLGCRNVTHLLVPTAYDLDAFFKGIYSFHPIVQHNKYANNYDYNKAVWLLNKESLLDNGFILLKEDPDHLACPTASLLYSRYSSATEAQDFLEKHRDAIQCVVGHGYLPFGNAQAPALSDYADGVDTLAFLRAL